LQERADICDYFSEGACRDLAGVPGRPVEDVDGRLKKVFGDWFPGKR
jgi:hypothetical protein